MPEKIRSGAFSLLLILLLSIPFQLFAHEDDYIVGLSAFRDGLFDISAPSLETYLKGDTDRHKADYSHYLLYQMYLNSGDYKKSAEHLAAIEKVDDRRFDKDSLTKNRMLVYTRTDCAKAAAYLNDTDDETAVNYYLDSECKPDKTAAQTLLAKAKSDETKLKVVSKFSDDKEIVTAVFDSLDIAKADDGIKKYFALYFYKNGDPDRFAKVREVYEDADVVGIELDSLWQKGDKDAFLADFEKYKEKYKLTGANACRAIDVYKNSGRQFDCSLVNLCIQDYNIDFVKLKGACLVKNGDRDKLTEFIDSLKPTIFPGMCAYGEYIFHNGLYIGKSQDKFYQCDERYKIADVIMAKGDYQSVVNMFYKKNKDKDRYYTASALKKLGKTKAADDIAGKIKDETLKAKYSGGAK